MSEPGFFEILDNTRLTPASIRVTIDARSRAPGSGSRTPRPKQRHAIDRDPRRGGASKSRFEPNEINVFMYFPAKNPEYHRRPQEHDEQHAEDREDDDLIDGFHLHRGVLPRTILDA